MMEALRVVADSWPIASMVIGVTVAFVVWSTIKRTQQLAYAERSERANGSHAVVVQPRPHADD